jgi:hypothetical protein
MPIDRDRYRPDWEEFSHSIKCAAKWTCQQCGKVCRQQGESVEAFANRAFQPESPVWKDAIANPQKFCLTVAHLDQDPSNDSPDNIQALCTKCHLNYDRPHLVSNIYSRRERCGQGVLAFWESD